MTRFLALLILTPLVLLGCAKGGISVHKEGPHIEPGASAAEIQQVMNESPTLKNSEATRMATQEVALALTVGARAYEWLKNLNERVAEGQKFSFSNRATVKATPIEQPEVYNAVLIVEKVNAFLASLPPGEMRDVLVGNKPIPSALPAEMNIAQFLEAGHTATRIYDLATRWVMMSNFMDRLIIEQASDVRGYFFFKKMTDVEGTLNDYIHLPADQQAAIREALTQLCLNDSDFLDVSRDDCVMNVAKAVAKKKLLALYREHRQAGERKYKNFFKLSSDMIRTDVSWDKKTNVMRVPFFLPPSTALASYVRDNVQDEWRTANWNLKIDFTSVPLAGLSRLEFQEGALAHAELNKIVMDQNELISEWQSRSTIRHEFGHLLGFKDCYVEFYDESQHAIVNYQLDTTDIMCSSSTGHFKKSHFERLQDAYKK